MRRQDFFPVLDRMLEELANRFFPELGKECRRGNGHVILPQSSSWMKPHWNILLSITAQRDQCCKTFPWQKNEGESSSIQSVFSLLEDEMFPSVNPSFKLLCPSLTKIFQWLHAWLRITMRQDRRSNFAIMCIELEILDDVDHEEVIDGFAKLKLRCFNITRPPTYHHGQVCRQLRDSVAPIIFLFVRFIWGRQHQRALSLIILRDKCDRTSRAPSHPPLPTYNNSQ